MTECQVEKLIHSYQCSQNSGRLGDTHESMKWVLDLYLNSMHIFHGYFFYGIRFHIEMINGLNFAVFLFKKCSAIYQIRLFCFHGTLSKLRLLLLPIVIILQHTCRHVTFSLQQTICKGLYAVLLCCVLWNQCVWIRVIYLPTFFMIASPKLRTIGRIQTTLTTKREYGLRDAWDTL